MACFPRFFNHRNKNSFSPRDDNNSDPIVNNVDNPVQIGRYIRREEKTVFTPLLTPSASEAQLHRSRSQLSVSTTAIPTQQRLQTNSTLTEDVMQSGEQINDISHSQSSQQIENVTPANTYNQHKGNAMTDSSQEKKFKSNKGKILLNKDKNNNNDGGKQEEVIIDDVVNGNAISVQRLNSKLKPVKQRRATALPNEVPKIEDNTCDNDDSDDSESQLGSKITVSSDNEALNAAKTNDACCSFDGKTSSSSIDSDHTKLKKNGSIIDANGWTTTITTEAITTLHTPQTPPITQSNTPSSTTTTTAEALTSASTLDLLHTTDTPATPTTTISTLSKENVKFFIGTSSSQDDDNASVHADSISIRTSHTLSAKLLTPRTPPVTSTTTTNGLLWPGKNCSNASLNYLSKKQLTTPNGTVKQNRLSRHREFTVPDIYIPPPPPMPTEPLVFVGTPMRPRKLKKSYSVPTTNYEKSKSNADPAKFTFAELLNIASDEDGEDYVQKSETMYSYFHFASLNRNCYNGSNSRVQIEDQPDTAKGIDFNASPKSHRLQGGLIYSRPNPGKKDIEIVFIEKDEATRNLIHTAIERNDFLSNLMDKERKEMVINAMAPANYDKDSYIILEKEEGSDIYVSAEGYYDVIRAGQHVGNFGPVTVFGELAILYNAPRQATIRAATRARVWKISRETFRAIIQISGSREREENLKFLQTAPFLKDLNDSVLNKVVDLLQRKFYEAHSCIVREGEVGNEFFIIRGGTVTIKKRGEDLVEQVVDRRKRGDYFGEQALLNADRRQASVYADPPGTEVLMLDREAFISYLGTIPQLREKPGERESDNLRTSNKSSEFDNENAYIPLSELKKVATLGAGAFGRVDLVTHGSKTFALKIIKKIDVVKQDQVEHVYNEKNVMIKCSSSPFIVELYRTYRNEKYVYFLMEACMGGDVWTVMTKRQYFDDKTAKFIAACVVEAFDFLHSHNIVYRDLKPENLMLTIDGYCKLVDFGFAKYVRPYEKTNTFAGTPEYVAPEIILDRGHDRAVDYWALGILIFELLVGKTPFRGDNSIKIYQQILSGIDVIHMPTRIPKSAQGLIKHLCKQLPAERLGYQRRGIQDIKRHSWFDSLDWSKLKCKQLPSPIKRPIKSNTNLQYFEPPGIEHDYEPPDELSGWDIDF